MENDNSLAVSKAKALGTLNVLYNRAKHSHNNDRIEPNVRLLMKSQAVKYNYAGSAIAELLGLNDWVEKFDKQLIDWK